MNKLVQWGALLTVTMLAACSPDTEKTEFRVDTSNALVKSSLPSIRKACPGLDKFASELGAVRIQENLRTTLVFDVPDSAQVPSDYKAAGNTCFIEIEGDGKSAVIEKAACKAICLDRIESPGKQLVLNLAGD